MTDIFRTYFIKGKNALSVLNPL